MKKLSPVVVAFVSFCLISFHSNPAFAAVIDAVAPPEDAVAVPLELEEPDDATAAAVAASVVDAIPEEAASVPSRRRRTLAAKKGEHTQEAFTARYPELLDLSPADQTVQYQAYLLYSNGMTVDELDAYYNTHDNGQQEGGGGAGATSAFSCCKDNRTSSGCRTERRGSYCLDRTTPDQKYECEFAGSGIFRGVCCRTFPDNRVGSKFWVWEPCI